MKAKCFFITVQIEPLTARPEIYGEFSLGLCNYTDFRCQAAKYLKIKLMYAVWIAILVFKIYKMHANIYKNNTYRCVWPLDNQTCLKIYKMPANLYKHIWKYKEKWILHPLWTTSFVATVFEMFLEI